MFLEDQMSIGYSKEAVLEHLNSWDFECKTILEEGAAYTTVFKLGNKKLTLTTPYEVDEFFFDFFVDGELIFTDWYERMDDDFTEYMQYTESVVRTFLTQEVRIKTNGLWFWKTYFLECSKKGVWENIF